MSEYRVHAFYREEKFIPVGAYKSISLTIYRVYHQSVLDLLLRQLFPDPLRVPSHGKNKLCFIKIGQASQKLNYFFEETSPTFKNCYLAIQYEHLSPLKNPLKHHFPVNFTWQDFSWIFQDIKLDKQSVKISEKLLLMWNSWKEK